MRELQNEKTGIEFAVKHPRMNDFLTFLYDFQKFNQNLLGHKSIFNYYLLDQYIVQENLTNKNGQIININLI